MLKNALFKQAASGFVFKVLGAGLAFVVSALLARYLGAVSFGKYALVMSVANVAAAVAALGLPLMIVRQVAVYRSGRQWGELKGIVRAAHAWPLLAAALICVLFLIGYRWIPDQMRRDASFGLLLIPVLAINQIRAAIVRGFQWVVLADIPELLIRPLVILVCLGLAIAYGQTLPDEQWALSFQLAALAATFAIGSAFLLKALPAEVRRAHRTPAPREFFLGGTTFLAVALIAMLEGQSTLLLTGLLSGAGNAGVYQAVTQVVSLVVFGLVAVNMGLQPRLAAAWAQGDKFSVQHLATYSARLGMAVAALIGLVLIAFPGKVLAIFGQSFVEGAAALRILVIGQLVNAASGPCAVVLSMTGHQTAVLHAVIIALCLNACLCWWLIPEWGLSGAALAATAGLLAWNLFMAIQAQRLTGIGTTIFRKESQ